MSTHTVDNNHPHVWSEKDHAFVDIPVDDIHHINHHKFELLNKKLEHLENQFTELMDSIAHDMERTHYWENNLLVKSIYRDFSMIDEDFVQIEYLDEKDRNLELVELQIEIDYLARKIESLYQFIQDPMLVIP